MFINQILTKLKSLVYSKSETDSLLGGKANSSHTHTKSQITDFPSLATVATSGNYTDLSNKPTIPTVNNATLTIQKNGTTVKTFTANASSNVTANISVPTKVSQLTNDSGFITSSGSCNYANSAGSAEVADYAKLLAYSHTNEINFKGGRQATCYFNYRNADDDSTGTAATVEYKFCNYGGGSVSNVTVSAGTFKENGSSLADKYQAKGSYASSSHTHTKSQITDFPTIPTKVSQFTNDSGFITSEIDSSGNGWVRFKSGIQICYGSVNNANGLGTGRQRISFPKAFNATPNVIATPDISARYVVTANIEGNHSWILNTYSAYGSPIDYVSDQLKVSYVAIGKWK